MATACAMAPASATTSAMDSRPISGRPRAAAMPAPETYTALKPARSIWIAVSALNAPGSTTVPCAINSRRRRGFDGVGLSTTCNLQQRHQGPGVLECLQLPHHVNHLAGPDPVETGSSQAPELLLDLAIRERVPGMAQRIIHLFDVLIPARRPDRHARRHRLRIPPDELFLFDHADLLHERPELRIGQALGVEGLHGDRA